MKAWRLFSLLLLLTNFATAMTASTNIRLSSWNLRFDSKPDNISVKDTLASLPDPTDQPSYLNISGEQPWSTRRIRVAQRLLSERIALAGAAFLSLTGGGDVSPASEHVVAHCRFSRYGFA